MAVGKKCKSQDTVSLIRSDLRDGLMFLIDDIGLKAAIGLLVSLAMVLWHSDSDLNE
jgi:hypothetical protein